MAGRRSDPRPGRPVVWVTGASRGIGREIAKKFASIGCLVCLSAREERSLRNVQREIERSGGIALPVPCDFSETLTIVDAAKVIRQRAGGIDVLVNNAGVTVFKTFLDTTLGEFDEILDTNLHGPIVAIKSVLPGMIRRKRGWIINILSNAAIKTFEGASAYSATKAGMLGLSRVLREELKRYNVRVTSVIPGPTETRMWSAPARRAYGPRMMSAKSVAEAVLAAYRMPEDLVVDEIVVRPLLGDIE